MRDVEVDGKLSEEAWRGKLLSGSWSSVPKDCEELQDKIGRSGRMTIIIVRVWGLGVTATHTDTKITRQKGEDRIERVVKTRSRDALFRGRPVAHARLS